ncbi:endocuticle structural glycoprotein SgAbd-3 [Schistocerca piceifrons]|nr:endocuticle structural glycoprotein SgAbd-3 [Schistocerca piceifrons]XP_049793329.1 endocuticle structural glycoprotein SgAbd-3 [Schistocerca nitens]XP_049838692.1 endocuticle structural glycoprotein SgAbd-3 [Schistocerca gregaria]XP_049941833.1 endocuticle structural glycoprotein SgAbd-3 [Schistocerca serialis cubense]
MFFKLVTVLCLAAAAMALPQRPVAGGRGKDAVIVSATNDVNFDGSYRYSFETSDGQRASQEGALKQVSAPGPDGDGLGEAVRGDFSYTDDAGNQFAIQYTADENGYVPQGAHLPTPPPIPEAIQKALAYIASQPQARS